MSDIKAKIRVGGQGVKVTTAFLGKNSLANASLQDLGDVQNVPQNVEEGSFLEYDTNSNSYVLNNVMDSGIF